MQRGDGHLVICQDVHTFGYLARSKYPDNVNNLGRFVVNLGWVVEGRKSEDLPEQILGCIRLNRINLRGLENIDDLMNANSVGAGEANFKIKPSQWIEAGMHLK